MKEHNCNQIINNRKSSTNSEFPKIVFDEEYNGWFLEIDGRGDWDYVSESIVFCPFCGAVLSRE